MPEIWLEMSKNSFWQKLDFVKIKEFSLLKLKNCKNCKIYTFMFLAISLVIFELQRRTIPHFNPLNNSFWLYEEQFYCRFNTFWVLLPNVSTIFFAHTLGFQSVRQEIPKPITMYALLQRKQSGGRWDLSSEVVDSLDNVATLMWLPCCVMDFLAFKKPF